MVFCILASTAAAAILSIRAEKQYEATTALLLRSSSAFEPQRAVDTNLQLLGLPAVAKGAAETLPGAVSYTHLTLPTILRV